MNRRHALGSLVAAGFAPVVARTPDDIDEFIESCKLPDEETIKFLAAPLPEGRNRFFFKLRPLVPNQIPTAPGAIVFHFDKKGVRPGPMQFGGPPTIETLLDFILDVRSQEIVGPEEWISWKIPGDWVVRPDASPESRLADFEHALRTKLKLDLSLEFKAVERMAIVARGKFKFDPPEAGRKRIHVYGDAKCADHWGQENRSGDFTVLLRCVGSWISKPIVSEVENPHERRLDWTTHRNPTPGRGRPGGDRDPELVLKHLTEQTQLEFTEEKRMVRSLVIEERKKR